MRNLYKLPLILLIIILVLFIGTYTVQSKENPAPEELPAPSRVITPEEAKELLEGNTEYLLLDVRDRDEFDTGHIAGAVCIPYTMLEDRRDELPDDPEMMILVYCRSGRRSAIAAETLVGMGYRCVLDFGGIIDWPYEITEQDKVTDMDCEHFRQIYDCSYERCSKCGKLKNYD